MRKLPAGLMVGLTLLAAAGMVGVVIWRMDRKIADVRIGFQDADAPLEMPEDGEIDYRFAFPAAWEAADVPVALRFDWPMGSANGALVYDAQKFWEMNDARGGHHTGDDLNGIGGMNTDLGDPVFSTADGRVLYAGESSPGWGKIVVVAHRTADGRTLHSMYAHLNHIGVVPGMLVARGGEIGTVGTANGYYPAHLHFEMRESDQIDIGPGYAADPLNRLDPLATLALLRNAEPADLSPSPLTGALAAGPAPWTTLEIQGAERLSRLPGPSAD